MRSGVIGTKVGMSCTYDAVTGVRTAVTLIHMSNCEVISNKTDEKHGYSAVVVGAINQKKESRLTAPLRGMYKQLDVACKKKIKEFRVDGDNLLPKGHVFRPSYFVEGQHIDVVGQSIGKGFAGVMKRHNFRGLEASHGVSISHRSHGSTGQRQDPGKVFKGKKMAGHLGDQKVTVQNLQIQKIDDVNNLLIVKGAIPGCKGSYVYISDSVKKQHVGI